MLAAFGSQEEVDCSRITSDDWSSMSAAKVHFFLTVSLQKCVNLSLTCP